MNKYLIKQSTFSLFAVFLSIVLFTSMTEINAQKKTADNSACLGCHDDPTITMTRGRKEVSLNVKSFTLPRSVHGSLKCQDCHKGFDPDNVPHMDKIQPVNCMNCHTDAFEKHKFHPQMKKNLTNGSPNGNCKGCHGYHDVTSPKNPNSKTSYFNSTQYCGNCHKLEKDLHMVSQHSIELKKNDPNAPTCIYCHRYPITPGNTKFKKVELKLNQEKLCASCHIKNAQNSFSRSLIDYDKSVHGMAIRKGKNAAICVDCHGSHDLKKASDPKSSVNRLRIPEVCGKCHISIAMEYSTSIHGITLKKGNPDSPGCTYCHGEHAIRPQAKVDQKIITDNQMSFNTMVTNKMLYCVECHTNEAMMKKYNILTVSKAHDWLPNKGAHWETVRCVDCHSSYDPPKLSHNILPPDKTIKKCEECHSKNSILMSVLYKHEKEKSREKLGFINGTVLSDAYVVGTTRNIYLDILSFSLLGLTVAGLGLHGLLRWYFRKGALKVEKKHEDIGDARENEKD